MAWAGGVWDDTGTSTGNISFGLQIYYDRKFLKHAVQQLRLVPLGQKRPIPKGAGKQIRFFRYNVIDPQTTALTEGTNPDPTVIKGQEINATLAEYGAFSQHSSLVSQTHIDRELEGVVGLWGDNAGESIDLLTWTEVAQYGIYPMRVDDMGSAAASYSVASTVVESTNNTSVALIAGSATVGTTADWWNGGVIEVYAGTNIGQSRVVSDYASSGTWCTVTVASGFEAACDSSSKFRLTRTQGLTTGDVPTYKTIVDSVAILKGLRAMPFADGYYTMLMDPIVTADLMSDATWIGLESYRGSASKLYAGEVGRFAGVRVIETTKPWRTAAGTHGTYTATGNVFVNLILGREAFGVTHFPGMSKPKIIVKNPGPADTSNPLNRFSTVGWQFTFVPKALNANYCLGLMSYH